MDALNLGTAITAIVSLIGLIGGAFLATYKLGVKAGRAEQGMKIGTLEEKVRGLEGRLGSVQTQLDVNDEFTLNIAQTLQSRAEVQAEQDKMIDATGASIKLTPKWRERLEPIKPALLEWYNREGRYLPEWKVFWVFDQKFRVQIVKHICKPHNLNALQCLVAALLLCKESSEVFTIAGDTTPMPQKPPTDHNMPKVDPIKPEE